MAEEFKPQYSFTDDRLNELKQLFPEAWEDGVFNVDTLRSLIGDYSTDNSVKEHFGLNWVGKQDARKIASKPPTGTLKPAPGEGVNEENTENIFIEGDNLEVLKILRKSYMGKIKMIYIDPPYNTGNDFIYNDSFGDSTEDYLRKSGDKSEDGLLVSNPKTTGKYHANWLTFMYPRIRLAKDLLKEDGVIFISIDDNEVDNLKKVCDEVFGEENFVSLVTRATGTPTGGGGSSPMVNELDYLLVYFKSQNSKLKGIPLTKEESQIYNKEDKRGKYLIRPLRRTGGEDRKEDRPTMFYPLVAPDKSEVYPVAPQGYDSRWICGISKYQELNDSGLIEWKNENGKWTVYQKFYLEGRLKQSGNLWNKIEGNKKATRDIRNLFDGVKVFDFPKPLGFITKMFNITLGDNDIVLDFFGGSGSTAHALLKHNEEFKLNNKFIIVQLNETITEKSVAYREGYREISSLSIERIKRAIQSEEYSSGFKVFKLRSSSLYQWKNFEPQKDGLLPDLFTKLESAFKNPLVEGTTHEEFITEVMLQEGFPLTAKQTEVQGGIFKISHDWVPYTLYVSMLQSFKNIDIEALGLSETDHFVCLDMAFENNDALKQTVDNQCKLFTV